uniref:Gamma-aminobutyric acid receptor NB14.1 (Fragments) n=1 Tax=Drosophila sp. TaxID=7242 RepID=Q7M4F6_DROSP
YDKRVRPNYGGPPVEVGVTMYVLSISSVSEVLMDFTLDFYFRQFRQLCHIEIESFGYTMRDIRYFWRDGLSSVGMSSEVELPQFRVLGHRQRATEINLTTGNYSR